MTSMGFKLAEELELRNSDAEWQVLQGLIQLQPDAKVKHEVKSVDTADVFPLQEN